MRSILYALFAFFITLSAFASEPLQFGDLKISQPTARETPPGAKVAAGYLTIENTGSADDRLIGGSAPFAAKVEIHEMAMDSKTGTMKMGALAQGLPVKAGQIVKLRPAGYHVMFMGVKEQLKAGEQQSVSLEFEKAGTVEIVFDVKTIAETIKMKD